MIAKTLTLGASLLPIWSSTILDAGQNLPLPVRKPPPTQVYDVHAAARAMNLPAKVPAINTKVKRCMGVENGMDVDKKRKACGSLTISRFYRPDRPLIAWARQYVPVGEGHTFQTAADPALEISGQWYCFDGTLNGKPYKAACAYNYNDDSDVAAKFIDGIQRHFHVAFEAGQDL